MRAVVLGAAAGGGFPQWNCRCETCALAWSGDSRASWRTQSAVAVTGDDATWVLLNASPDLSAQIRANRMLWPSGIRHSPIGAVILTSGEIDHVAGLFSLRERHPFTVIALRQVHDAMNANPMLEAVRAERLVATPGEPIALPGGLSAMLFPVPGKVPLYLERGESGLAYDDGETAGVRLTGKGGSIVYIPGCAAAGDDLIREAAKADVLFFDGTLFTDDEMIRAGLGEKTGRRMGHMPISGEGGSLAWLRDLPRTRRIYIHLNNSNPALIDGSPERQEIEAAGVEVAFDGMEVVP
ncbi:pyrroloquinoline quinone biosynthesis protein PqqB [Bosea sp. (in: a-proteobacteria)]|uniref:pyrroloquinoline quinone biosynthesis protein PqqB n=1 Tax=Bosea sp. (in: a-proteobacteria) TaxID=1871050 RepID=UPI0027368207|nr:pyrroloquinoline quinone biosynthesis protein PqqB [Bosea sp. (in: a-proteobacteria)]MDP3406699.1 pyrroloquinoline quinone biosynthesis protein PqqB [Bosea sp. (in: a-proteobacteria)]